LDLRQIALQARNCEYNPRRFAAVIMRHRDALKPELRTTALIFRSGKVVVTGAKSEELAETAAKHFSKILKKLFPAKSIQM